MNIIIKNEIIDLYTTMFKYMKIINLSTNKYLKWIVTNKCNYNCSYCFERNFDNSYELSNEELFLTANKINEFMKIKRALFKIGVAI